MLVKPKAFEIIDFPGKFSHCLISLFPQQNWVAKTMRNRNIELSRENVAFEIDKIEFERLFIEEDE